MGKVTHPMPRIKMRTCLNCNGTGRTKRWLHPKTLITVSLQCNACMGKGRVRRAKIEPIPLPADEVGNEVRIEGEHDAPANK